MIWLLVRILMYCTLYYFMSFYQSYREFLLCLSLCHTVIVEEDPKTNATIYNSASPDELALVQFAKYSGWEYKGMNKDNQMVIHRRLKPGAKPKEFVFGLEEVL